MNRDSGVAGPANLLLDAPPAAEIQRLMLSLSPVFINVETVLFEPGEIIESVEFPRNCVISLVAKLHDGAFVEVAQIGNEGIVGVPQALQGSLAVRAVCSVAGWAYRLDAPTFRDEVERDGALRDLVQDYLQALFGQISRAAGCNRLHANGERVSRWLLMAQDRVGTDAFAITHGLLARMLGSRRATVTVSAEYLQAAGLIRYRRGHVTIVDRAGLEAATCECYEAIERELIGVVQRAQLRSPAS